MEVAQDPMRVHRAGSQLSLGVPRVVEGELSESQKARRKGENRDV